MANLAQNRKAHFNYEMLEKMEAGIELLGIEVKSLRGGQESLDGAYVIIRGGEAYLIGATIPPYQPNNTGTDYDATRNRRLLLTKKELAELASSESKAGLTIVPLSMYNKGRKIKIEIAIAKGKKLHDKRETIKKRDTDREMRREFRA